MTRPLRLVALALVATLAACADDPAGPEPAEPIADEALVTLFGGGVAPTGPGGTRACPAGGEIATEHDVDIRVDGDDVSVEFEATLEHRSCAHLIDGDRMISDGHMRYAGTQRARREGERVRVLESVVHQTGRMRIRYRDYDRTCDIDLTQTLDAQREELRLTGTHCGKVIDVVVSRPVPGM